MTSNYESLLRERQIHRKSRIVPIVLVLLLATIAVVTSVVLLAANNRTRPSLLPSLLPHLPEYAEELSLTNVFPSSPNSTLLDEPDRPLILYAYHETKNARLNAEFFIRHALHDGADFLFILNGETDLQKVIPKADHIKVRQRPNTCFDIGSYAEVLLGNDKKLLTLYKKFIMINASVRGPFIPTWSNQCWSESYLSQVTEEVKLVGMSYNCKAHLQYPKHVQSMLLATDRMGMDILLEKSKMAKCAKDMDEAVEVEVTLSPTIVDYGYKVKAFMTAYSSSKHYAETCSEPDFQWNNKYYGTNIHPYESIFQKANRDIDPIQLSRLTEWHDGMEYSSQPYCGRKKVG